MLEQDTLGYAKYSSGAMFSHGMANPLMSPLRQPHWAGITAPLFHIPCLSPHLLA